MNLDALIQADKSHIWHPFTQMQDWCAPGQEPLFITSGKGATLTDARGRSYLDANSTIWTNIHGHSHPHIIEAIKDQADRIAHVSGLGFGNIPATKFAEALINHFPKDTLSRVFYTSDGSCAIECALKMEIQYRQLTHAAERNQFIGFTNAYHGDTIGAASIGAISTFTDRFSKWGLTTHTISTFEELESLPEKLLHSVAAVLIEPLIQGAAGMQTWPAGMLARLRNWCDTHGIHLMLDEIMTGFGRTGSLFACEQEGIVPDYLILGKGITGGTLPLAATLTREKIFEAFLGSPADQKTFYYGHSYTGNPLACSAALASWELFSKENTLQHLPEKIAQTRRELETLRSEIPCVAATRQCGLIAGIDLRQRDGTAFDWTQQIGAKVCLAARQFGVLTRPVRDTLVFMPPLCVTESEIEKIFVGLRQGIEKICLSENAEPQI